MPKKKVSEREAKKRHTQVATALVVFIQHIPHDFIRGDAVTDLTAKRNRWPDVKGVIRKVDGPVVLVEYTSGNKRWKSVVNLKKIAKKNRG